ncbi:MAG: NAD(P)-dependent oxidoreductase [Mycetocola sp.]
MTLIYPLTSPRAQRELELAADVTVAASDSEADIVEAIHDAEGIIIRGPARLTGTLMDAAPNLRVIASSGSGADSIDIEAATKRGILVTNNAGTAPGAVTEYVLSAAGIARRQFPAESAKMFSGQYSGHDWDSRVRNVATQGVIGAAFGIIGFGHIGRDVARRAKAAFDAEIVVYDPVIAERSDDVSWASSVLELCERSDIVSVHVPLLDSTRGLISRRELDAIGPDGALIDAARGNIVVFEDLIAALREGTLGSAVIDVFDVEPPTEEMLNAIRDTPHLFATPHIAGASEDSMYRLASGAGRTVLDVLGGTLPPNALNAQVWPSGSGR